MATIEIPDDLLNRIEKFTPVVRAVLNEDADPSTSLECIAKLTDRPLVLRRKAWYGRLTDSEAVRYEPSPGR